MTPEAASLLAEGYEQVLAAIAVAPDTEWKHGPFVWIFFFFLAHARVCYSCLERREEKRDAKMPSESWKAVLSALTRWLLLQAQLLPLLWLPTSSLLLLSPYLWGQDTLGQAVSSFCSRWAPLPACWGAASSSPAMQVRPRSPRLQHPSQAPVMFPQERAQV